MLEKEGWEATSNFKFPLDQLKHCEDWFVEYYSYQALGVFVVVLIGLTNVVSEVLVNLSSVFTRPNDHTDTIIRSVTGISWI